MIRQALCGEPDVHDPRVYSRGALVRPVFVELPHGSPVEGDGHLLPRRSSHDGKHRIKRRVHSSPVELSNDKVAATPVGKLLARQGLRCHGEEIEGLLAWAIWLGRVRRSRPARAEEPVARGRGCKGDATRVGSLNFARCQDRTPQSTPEIASRRSDRAGRTACRRALCGSGTLR